MELIIALGFVVFYGFTYMFVAQRRGRSGVGWFSLGCFIGLIGLFGIFFYFVGLVVLLALPNLKKEEAKHTERTPPEPT